MGVFCFLVALFEILWFSCRISCGNVCVSCKISCEQIPSVAGFLGCAKRSWRRLEPIHLFLSSAKREKKKEGTPTLVKKKEQKRERPKRRRRYDHFSRTMEPRRGGRGNHSKGEGAKAPLSKRKRGKRRHSKQRRGGKTAPHQWRRGENTAPPAREERNKQCTRAHNPGITV